jgi:hypothetical protein
MTHIGVWVMAKCQELGIALERLKTEGKADNASLMIFKMGER